MHSFLDYCLANRDWLLDFIEALVAIESPSDDPAAVNRCGAELASRLDALGGAVTRVSPATAGDHLRVAFGTGPRQILLLGHFDTVWPIGQLATHAAEARGRPAVRPRRVRHEGRHRPRHPGHARRDRRRRPRPTARS